MPYSIINENMDQIDFEIGNKKIPFYLGVDCLAEFLLKLKTFGTDKYIFITDQNLFKLYGEKIEGAVRFLGPAIEIIAIEAGEENKTLGTVSHICTQILACGCSRRSIIIALGGGVIGNVAGFVASMLFRGIRLVHMPTTLLAMHDSVTSCKQAVNHLNSKNILGSYYAPTAVFEDIAFLKTLSPRHLTSGKAELVKNALIFGGNEYEEIESLIDQESEAALLAMIKKGISSKARLLKEDPYEKKQAIIFEYGHTVGHALEIYSPDRLTHGEAVAWGMYCAGMIALDLGMMSEDQLKIHQSLIMKLRLQALDPSIEMDRLMKLIFQDNKRGYITTRQEEVPMLLLTDIGKPAEGVEEHRHLMNVPKHMILLALTKLLQKQPLEVEHGR